MYVKLKKSKNKFFWMSFIFSPSSHFNRLFLFSTHSSPISRSTTLWWNGMPWNSILKTTLLEQQQNRVCGVFRVFFREEKKNVRWGLFRARFRNEVKWKNNRVTYVCVCICGAQGASKAFYNSFRIRAIGFKIYVWKEKKKKFNSPFLPSKISFPR